MSLGIACLLTDDDAAALAIAQRLHALNAERRSIEADMQETALASLRRHRNHRQLQPDAVRAQTGIRA